MGRHAGVTTEETRERLLRAAAVVFARLGYEKASISDITAEAGLSSGSIYGHFGSKAELFVAALRTHSSIELDRLLGRGEGIDVASVIAARGAALDRPRPGDGSLVVEAIVAAKHDPRVAELLLESFGQRERTFAALLAGGQAAGQIDASVAPDAAARLILVIALGSLLVSAMELPPVDHDGWSALIENLVDRFRADAPATLATPTKEH
ncbi:MAG TPA: helix-turn-helix domain-containing protein [Acidimicrobiales bacterium]|nr:helix-turn-helix domain-containing protein [Acidimicrobiales bacterium]